ncbi:MAG: GldG family protein [Vicinamibacteria bacterium]
MNRVMSYLGPLGLGALLAGVLLWMLAPDQENFWTASLLVGLLLSVVYLGTRWRELANLGRQRGARYGANLSLLIVLVAGIIIGINYIANRHSKRWDLTATQQYTLSDQAVSVLSHLDRDLHLTVFNRKDQAQAALDLLDQFRYQSNRITVEVVDQEAEPAKAARYRTSTEANIPFGTIVIDSGEKVERVSVAAEQDVINGIIRVIKEGKKKIYFIESHGEKNVEESATGLSIIKTKLEESNYEIGEFLPLQSMQEGRILVPPDAAALAIVGPQRDYLPAEIEMLREYLDGGGKVLFLLDPENQGVKPNLVAMLNDFGVRAGNNVVIDASGVGQLFGFGPEVPLVASYSSHTITQKFANVPTVYPFVRSVEGVDNPPEGVSITTLVSSSDNSWAEEDFGALSEGRVSPGEGERTGPLSLAVAITVTVKEPSSEDEPAADKAAESPDSGGGASKAAAEAEVGNAPEKGPSEGRAVVVGDSDFVSNALAGAPVANLDLFLNMVNWITEDEDLISIRPREPQDRRIFMNQQQQKNVAYLSLLFIPLAVLITGTIVWWGRRQ